MCLYTTSSIQVELYRIRIRCENQSGQCINLQLWFSYNYTWFSYNYLQLWLSHLSVFQLENISLIRCLDDEI